MSLIGRRTPRALVGLFAVLLSGAAVRVDAQSCNWTDEKEPSRAAHPDLWTGLQPTETNGLHPDRDTTDFTTNTAFTHSKPLWRSIDATDGWVFAGYNLGLHIFDGRGGNAAAPPLVASVKIESLPILHREPHDFYVITDVDAVDGDSDVVVMTGWDAVGLVALDTSVPSAPRIFYQDGATTAGAKYGEGVYAAKINGRYYGFMAAQLGNGAGLWVYDLTAGISGMCSEARPNVSQCPGIFKTKLSDAPQSHVDGTGDYVVFSGGYGGGFTGVEIWDVGVPSSPSKKLTGPSGRRVDGVAMWEQGTKIYLAAALRFPDEVRIYDVSCLDTGCAGNPLSGAGLYSFPNPGPASSRATVSHSLSDGQHYLYVGRSLYYGLDTLQAEWLLNVTSPGSPIDMTGGNPNNGNLGQPTIDFQGVEVGYWSWYYACHPSGSNFFEPAGGAVSNGYLYRAGRSILDVHEVLDASPTILVSVDPTTTYTDTSVQASANAINCTPISGGWTWSPGSGGSVVSGSGSSVGLSWTSTGTKSVSVSNTGCPGATVIPVVVNVQPAAPAVGSVSRSPATAEVCTSITFTANNVTGKPPLTDGWEILNSDDQPLASPDLTVSADGKTAVWDTAGIAEGAFKARYTATGVALPAEATSATVSLTPLAALAFLNPPFTVAGTLGTRTFQANVTGATEWKWTFGDGDVLETKDPSIGPNPTHTYTAVGNYDVTLAIRNCENDWIVSDPPIAVPITEVNPLQINIFQAVPNGPFGLFFDTGDSVSFATNVSGDPTTYDYDWDGNGTYDQSSPTPIASHVYNTAGLYRPVLRIRKGAAERVLQHSVPGIDVAVGDAPPPPSVNVSGPSTGEVDQARSFNASATNCTPGSWSWTATGGGAVSGSGTSVSIVWATPGTKTVRATPSGCSGASGTRSISITSNDNGPTPLKAAFVSAPAAPKVGEPLTFDASSSGGSPSEYFWDFGDGTTGSGKQTTHTYSQPGTRTVKLQVSKDDPGCQFGVCTDEMTKTVVIDGGQVTPSANGCTGDLANDPTKLCLLDERFIVDVSWRDQHNNDRTGVGTAAAYGSQGVTGFFWFFNPKKVELLVKILDARDEQTGLGNFWVFYGSLSDVHYTLKVTDTVTGKVKEYENTEGSLCGQADTGAFVIDEASTGAGSAALPFGSGGVGSVAQPIGASDGGVGDKQLMLLDGRFRVTVDWTNQHNGGAEGQGTAIPGSKESGYFWFFNQRNLELAVKIVDASALGEGFWIFWAGLSDVEYTLQVEDLETGQSWSRVNAPGNFCGGHDGDPVFD